MWLWKWKAKTKQRQFQRVRSVGTKPFASKMPETREIITVLEICQTLIYSKSSSLTESNSLTLCILVFKLNSVWSIASWLYSNPSTTWKVSKYGVFSGPYFPAFGLNTEIYSVNLSIQSECGKIRTRKNSLFGNFSRSDTILIWSRSRCLDITFLSNEWELKVVYQQNFLDEKNVNSFFGQIVPI